MAACHYEFLIVLGGICYEEPAEDVLCVRMQAKRHELWQRDFHLRNYEKSSHHRLFTDATVTVGGLNFQLHKHVLATGSPIFARMFSSEIQEGKTGSIVIDDMSAATFRLMVSYLYRTIDPYLPMNQAVDLLVASDKYGMTGLHASCIGIVTDHLGRLQRDHRVEVEELYEYATAIGNELIAKMCRKYLLTASRLSLCTLEIISTLLMTSSSEREGASSAPSAAAANTEEEEEEVDDIGDQLNVDQLDSFWIEELQEAKPQLPVPQDSLDGRRAGAFKALWPDSAQHSAILASEHLSSRMAGGSVPSVRGHHKHAQVDAVGLGVILSKGLVNMSDDSSLSRHDSSLSSDTGRSTIQSGELVSDIKGSADKGWAALSSTGVPSRTSGGLTIDSAASSSRGHNNLIKWGDASTSANSETICGAGDAVGSCTYGDSELDGCTAASNSSIKASWPDSARHSAILASEYLSSRMAGGSVPSVRGHHKHAQVDAVGLGVILSKGLVDTSGMGKQPDRAAVDSCSDRQPCHEWNFLCRCSAAEPACHIRPPDRPGSQPRQVLVSEGCGGSWPAAQGLRGY
ncbi:hypothetical protein WJX77_006754 [Trebouxia sp. C0004]